MQSRTVLLIALVCILAVATTVHAQNGKGVKAGAAKAAPAAAKGAAPAEASVPVRRKTHKSPIKGNTPKINFKGKVPAEKGKTRIPTRMSRANAGMGGAGFAGRPKAAAATKAPATKPAANAKPAAAHAKPNPKANANAKGKGKGLAAKHKFRALQMEEAQAFAESQVTADVFPQKTADGWKFSARLSMTQAQIDEFTALMPKLTEDKMFWHWDSLQACTRWSRAGLSEGEMKFFDSQMANMYSGGGLYFAEGPISSYAYGMFPCRIYIKAGTPQYSDAIAATAVSKKLLSASPTLEEKVALGQVIPFIHAYGKTASSHPPSADWLVTHSWNVFKSFAGGVFKQADGTEIVPHYDNQGSGGNTAGTTAVNIKSSLDLYAYWNKLMAVDALQPPLEPDSAKHDLVEGLKWLKSFTFLFSYIDGASLFRALGTSPQDPFNVFEKQRFPNFQAVYEKYINGRLNSEEPSLWGLSCKGVFGNCKDPAGVWAKGMLDTFLPNLYKELSQGGVMKFRDEEVRAGGDEEGKTFVATSGQVEVMKKNPYLLTVDSPARADGSILVYYYYPDALYRNPALKARVSPALWAACEEDVRLAGNDFASYKKTDAYKQHTTQLMSELILEAFTRLHGQSAEMDKGGMQIMLDLVSIHPCTDFNGRTTRFVGVVGALESKLEPPIAFMSDFDLTSPPALYGKFLKSGTQAYLNLKLALTSELLTGVCNGQMPDHYHVSYWAKLAGDALAPFGAKSVTYDDSDWDTIRSRRFVPLMDKKLGTNWTGRNGNAGTPVVQVPGTPPPVKAAPAAAPAATPAAPAAKPSPCAGGDNSCNTCMRLDGGGSGCGYHKTTKKCETLYVVNNNNRDYVLLAGDCGRF